MPDQLEKILVRLEGVKRNRRGYQACCPAHDDEHPSLSIWENNQGFIVLHCFVGCSRSDILQALYLTEKDISLQNKKEHSESQSFQISPNKKKPFRRKKMDAFEDRTEECLKYQEQLLSSNVAIKYLASRGIDLSFAPSFGVGFAREKDWGGWKWGRITFPHTTPDGKIVNLYGRSIGESHKITSKTERKHFAPGKHMNQSGPKGIFNARVLKEDTVYITEGVFDCLSLIMSGYPNSCAIFGLHGIRWEWFQARKIVLAFDNDKAGEAARDKLREEAILYGKEVSLLDQSVYRACKDLNEVWMKYGRIDIPEKVEQEVYIDTVITQPAESKLNKRQITGEIQSIKQIKTRYGHEMAFITLHSPQGIQKLTVFPKEFRQYKNLLQDREWIIADIKQNARGISVERISKVDSPK
ncbi:toprim domain-containing protein [Shimazuella kribbensis]|uniref:toprim domain-containing protein n=1 Tax=Shimazuella kribbensis TaxID=139808 RepID=UPI0003F94711|nr:toprim domain-containing protein [Shimazuella kribbensis]